MFLDYVSIAYWILLTMSVTIASTEISFSKLIYLKTTSSSLSEEMLRDTIKYINLNNY